MLRDRYPAVDLFALVPALALAFEPVLARLDTLLDDDALFQACLLYTSDAADE